MSRSHLKLKQQIASGNDSKRSQVLEAAGRLRLQMLHHRLVHQERQRRLHIERALVSDPQLLVPRSSYSMSVPFGSDSF